MGGFRGGVGVVRCLDHEGVVMKRVVVVVVMVACVVGVVACGASRGEPGVSVSSSVSVKPVPSVWPSSAVSTFSPVKSADQVAAEEVVAEYFRLKNELRKDPSLNLDPLEAIVDGGKPLREVEMLSEKRESNIIQVGDVKAFIRGSRLVEESKVEVSACTDATGVELKDVSKDEFVSDPDRPRYVTWAITVTHFGEQWRVFDFNSQAGESCS